MNPAPAPARRLTCSSRRSPALPTLRPSAQPPPTLGCTPAHAHVPAHARAPAHLPPPLVTLHPPCLSLQALKQRVIHDLKLSGMMPHNASIASVWDKRLE